MWFNAACVRNYKAVLKFCVHNYDVVLQIIWGVVTLSIELWPATPKCFSHTCRYI